MTTPRMLRSISLGLLLMVLASLLPVQQAAAQTSRPVAAAEAVGRSPEKIYAEGLKETSTPSLVLDVQVGPDTLAVGQQAVVTVTVQNQSAAPANSVVVSLPLPAGAEPADMTNFNAASSAWQWTIGRIDGRTTQTFSAAVRLTAMPSGAALVARPTVAAAELPAAIGAVGGALVEGPAAGGAATFTPGKAASLRAGDNRVAVAVPAGLMDTGLQLRYSTLAEKRQANKGFKAPPAAVGFKRGLGTFFLDATDAKGKPVHTFKQPLTIAVRYTPEQLEALGIAEADLTVFWYDEAAAQWVPQPTVVDPTAGTASTTVDHFSAYALGDGSSPSAAFIPSLQGWQVGLYSGSANYGMPIEVPAGPGGMKPSLELSYTSTASDGRGGQRRTQQAGWVGKGWSLDTGSVAYNKASVYSNQYNHYSVVMNGMSFDLVRAEAVAGNTGVNDPDPTHWAWRPTDENFVKVRVIVSGTSTSTRGGFRNGVAKPRHTWQVWTKDGTRYDFAEDLWWGWNNCAVSNSVDLETYKWQLTQVIDPSGNAITYTYGRDSVPAVQVSCDWWNNGQGTVDRDSWPTAISWGGHFNAQGVRDLGDRYLVEFMSSTRANDTQFEGADNQYGGTNGQPRETRRLDLVRVLSMPTNAWQVVREYQFGYDYSLLSDYSVNTGGVYSADAGTPKLTLKTITRVGKYDAPVTFASPIGTPGTANTRPGLPPMTFTYGTARGDAAKAYPTNGNWNRLTQVNNGQGGTVSFAYETIEAITADTMFRNNRRVTSKTTTDGRGNSATWSYAYTNPAYNWLGENITNRPEEPNNPNSATLYYAKKVVFGHDYTGAAEPFTAAMPYTQFRGHSQVVETAPDSSKTEHYFHQGDAGCTPTAHSSHASLVADACFIALRDREILKGKEFRTVVRSAAGALMTQTDHTFVVNFLDYSYLAIRGQWRAFAYESELIEAKYEGGATPLTRRTTYSYDPTYANGAGQVDGMMYGNLTRIDEYDAANALYRSSRYQYESLNTATSYIVDRLRAETIYNGASTAIAQTIFQYDGATTTYGLGARGLLTLVRKYTEVTHSLNVVIRSVDTSYGYDAYGHQIAATTYASPGTRVQTSGGTVFSAPGNGSAATTTTTTYDSVFHVFSTNVTYPPATTGATPLAESAGYDLRMGTLTSVTSPNDIETTINAQYDVFGRLERIIKPGDTVALPTIRAEYGDTELPVRYTTFTRIESGVSGSVQRASQFYDGLGRKIQTKTEVDNNATSVVVDTQYNAMGQPVRQYRERLQADTDVTIAQYTPTPGTGTYSTVFTYDALGRQLTTTTPDGAQTRHVFAINSNMLMDDTIDPNRHRIQRRTDVFGRLVGVAEIKGTCGNYWGYTCAAGETVWVADGFTTYAYSPLDLLTSVTDAQNNVTTMTYDTLGRKLTMSDPDMGAWAYSYDVDGNLLTQTDAKNQTITYGYDALSRVTSKVVPGTGTVTYGYDDFGEFAGGYGRGQRTSMSDPSGSYSWFYDQHGQIVQETQNILDQGSYYSYTTGRSYYANGKTKTLTYPTGETLSYAYDDAGQQKTITSSYGNIYLTGATYDALGQALTAGFGNGTTTTNSYYPSDARLYNRHITTGGTTLFRRYYTYELNGNVRSTDTLATPSGAAETLRFGYDDRDRLTSACAVATAASNTCLGGSTFNQTYAYDLIGNLTSKAGVAQTYPTNGVRPHAVSSVGGVAYTYDNNGNLLTGGGRTFTWNAENQPTQIVKGTTTETYTYNGDNIRVKKVSAVKSETTTTHYIGNLVELTGNTSISSYAGIAIRTVAGSYSLSNPGTVLYLHGDHLGSISVTTSGATGALVEAQTFDPWGALRSGGITSTEFNYTGQRKDAGTGLVFYNARYYDPAVGRFTQADSIVPNSSNRSLTVDYHESIFRGTLLEENNQGFWFQLGSHQRQSAAAPWGPRDPQELNRYAYVNNNPLRYTDPSGHEKGVEGGDSDMGYETVCTNADGTAYVDCGTKGSKIVEDKNGAHLMKVWKDGQVRYVWSNEQDFINFKEHVDAADDAWTDFLLAVGADAAAIIIAGIAACGPTGGLGCVAAVLAAIGFGIKGLWELWDYLTNTWDAEEDFDEFNRRNPPALPKPKECKKNCGVAA